MNGKIGWAVAVVVAVAATAFYFWPQLSQAPVVQQTINTAPVNSAQTIDRSMMTGTWQSNTDAKFTREFRADGVIYDRYQGDATAGVGGSWGVVLDVSKEAGITIPAASLLGKTVIKAIWEDGAEITYFSVDALSAASMTITDLSGRGGVTVFTKI